MDFGQHSRAGSDVDSELSLVDDDDGDGDVSSKLGGGTLSFTSPSSSSSGDAPESSPHTNSASRVFTYPPHPQSRHADDVVGRDSLPDGKKVLLPTARFTQTKLLFKVLSARTVKKEKDKHVEYSIAVNTTPSSLQFTHCGGGGGPTHHQVVIERRFTDFHRLHDVLKVEYPGELHSGVQFPRKTVIGNFSPLTIGQRSLTFERYLQHIATHKALRHSTAFLSFLHVEEMRVALNLVRNGRDYTASLPLLLQCVEILEEVCDTDIIALNTHTAPVLCALAVCYDMLEKAGDACKAADLALDRSNSASPHYVPLLHVAAHMRWSLGRDKRDVEKFLVEAEEEVSANTTTNVSALLDCIYKYYLV